MVIEPFAGSMAYSLYHRPKVALGLEVNERVVQLWRRLCAMDLEEIETMRIPEVGEVTRNLYWVLTSSSSHSLEFGYRTMTPFMHERAESQRDMTARHWPYANHVLYRWDDYREAPILAATYFIDPPYQGVAAYGEHSKIDYRGLAEWVHSLPDEAQVIACEGPNGTWLPFKEHKRFRGVRTKPGREHTNHEYVWKSEIRQCLCGAFFKPHRADHVHCSEKCRVKAFRDARRNV
jgi:hypothetical protein